MMDTVDFLNFWRILDAIWLPHSTVRELPYWGIFPLSAGSRAVFQVVGLRLLVIVEAFGMLYWGILPFGPFFQS